MNRTRPSRMDLLLIRLYPPSFRARYGDELELTMLDLSQRGWSPFDLLVGAARAWISPAFAGDAQERRRQRLQATASVVFVAWALSVCCVGAFGRGVDDAPIFAPWEVARRLFTTVTVLNLALAAGGFAVAAGYWLLIVRRTPAGRWRDVLVPAVAPAVIVIAWLLATLGTSVLVQRSVPQGGPVTPWIVLLLLAFLLVTAAAVAGCILTALVAFRRAQLPARALVPAAWLAPVGATLLLLETLAAIACLATIRWDRVNDPVLFAQGAVPVVLLAACTAIAGVSSLRGLSALRLRRS